MSFTCMCRVPLAILWEQGGVPCWSATNRSRRFDLQSWLVRGQFSSKSSCYATPLSESLRGCEARQRPDAALLGRQLPRLAVARPCRRPEQLRRPALRSASTASGLSIGAQARTRAARTALARRAGAASPRPRRRVAARAAAAAAASAAASAAARASTHQAPRPHRRHRSARWCQRRRSWSRSAWARRRPRSLWSPPRATRSAPRGTPIWSRSLRYRCLGYCRRRRSCTGHHRWRSTCST